MHLYEEVELRKYSEQNIIIRLVAAGCYAVREMKQSERDAEKLSRWQQ